MASSTMRMAGGPKRRHRRARKASFSRRAPSSPVRPSSPKNFCQNATCRVSTRTSSSRMGARSRSATSRTRRYRARSKISSRTSWRPRRASAAEATAAESGSARPGSSVAVLDAYDVVELGGRDLDDVAVLDAGHAVQRPRRDVEDVARLHLDLAQLAVLVLGPRLEE